jgi:hypothetical protein
VDVTEVDTVLVADAPERMLGPLRRAGLAVSPV